MLKQIIKIDVDKCDGCGACVTACHEDAIGLVNGKAQLLREDYCDGLGDCLSACPLDAISFEQIDVVPISQSPLLSTESIDHHDSEPFNQECSCSENAESYTGDKSPAESNTSDKSPAESYSCDKSPAESYTGDKSPAELRISLANWPIQIKLVPEKAGYYDKADLLIAADCTAFAYSSFHPEFLSDHTTLIGCPKLDAIDYTEKLAAIFQNDIKSITVLRMEVPCCKGLATATQTALQSTGKTIPLQVIVLSRDGRILG
ncbi:MAG: 4Fe-4S dicluster domain-containing protein [Coriobacteriales bacterium]|jgi:NAD-dependent dihydropyrimidine dehydrogenase PreA subunit|nr:4Fe-4S dicluster domain-containing protein [Coriobacteriales bacterium]